MRKIYILFLVILFVAFNFPSMPQAPKGGPSTEAVAPVELDPHFLAAPAFFDKIPRIAEGEEVPDQELINKLRQIDLPVIPNDKSIFFLKTEEQIKEALQKGEKPQTNFIYEWNRGSGPVENGSIPPDPNLAVGPAHVVVAVNKMINIYSSRDFSLLSSNTLNNWFGRPSIKMFDPKIIYEPWGGRWIILVLEKSDTESNYLISVSQTTDPTGRWWIYRLRANVDGSNTTNYWADYPGLGYSYPIGGTANNGCIAITSNQYNRSSPARYQYGKVRLLKTSQLYVGASVTWYDFWDISFTNQPARQLSSTANSNLYLMHVNHGGGSSVDVYRIDNPTSSNPSWHNQSSIGVTSYHVPPPARQLGGVGLLDALDCRTQDVWMLANHLFSAWTSAYNYGSGNKAIVHFVRINISNNSLAQEVRIGNEGEWLMQASACPEYKAPFTQGRGAISFTRSSPSIWAQGCTIGFDGSGPTNYIGINSTGYYNQSTTICDTVRWGDYSGVAPDPAQNGVFWSVSETVNPKQWTTGVLKFSFTQKPTLVVTTPNGGERWYIGATRNIIWTSNGIDNVKIEYSINNGASWSTLIASTPALPGAFGWRVPNTPSTQCKVRVSDAGGTDVRDESNNTFTIEPAPSITLLLPNGGETWYTGTSRSIRWNCVNMTGNIRIEYSTNSGMWWLPVTEAVPVTNGIFLWNIPNTPSAQCKVRIYDPNNEFTLYDQSDHNFTISNASHLVLRAPNGGERWTVGSVHNIEWDRGTSSQVALNYSTDAGKTWLRIASNIDASLGSYPWTIPNTISDACLVEVYDVNDSNFRDQSNSIFRIVMNPFITVLSPNGGERWYTGYKQTITWRSEGLKLVKIEYCTDGGKNWMTIQEAVNADAGAVTITAPNTPGQSCYVRIGTSDLSIYDVSDYSFMISGDSPLAIINPRTIGYVLGLGNTSTARYQLANAGAGILNYKVITSYLKGPEQPAGTNTIESIREKSKAVNITTTGVMPTGMKVFPEKREVTAKATAKINTGTQVSKPKYTRKAVLVKSWGDNPVWEELQTNWASYGTMAVEIDRFSLIDVTSFTLQDLINSNADVVILSNSAGGYKQISREEADALIMYAAMGHNIVGTYAVFQTDWVDNRHLAPLFGLTAGFNYTMRDFSPEFEIYSSQNQIFNSIYSPYISSGYNYSQVPYSWDTANYTGAVCIAKSTDKKGVVTLYNANTFSSIYISHMPEYYGNYADATLLYNAITYMPVYNNWLFPFPLEGQIMPSYSAEIGFEAKSANLPEGDYEANVFITTDDPANPSISIPVTMRVNAPAKPAPKNLVAGDSFAGMVPLTWSTPDGATDALQATAVKHKTDNKKPLGTASDTVAYYKVFFAVSSGGPYLFLDDVNPYLNKHENNQNYIDQSMDTLLSRYYVVSAVYKDGSESGYSNEAYATTTWEGHRKFLPYAVTAPQIDGVINPQEWSDALVSDINVPGIQVPVKLYLKNSESKLFLALEDQNNVTSNDENDFAVYTDFDNNNLWPLTESNNEGCFFSSYTQGVTRNLFRTIYGQYPTIVSSGTEQENPATMNSKVSFATGHYTQEMAIDIPPLPTGSKKAGTISDIINLWLAYYDQAMGNESYYGGSGYYPYGSIWAAPSTYGKFVLAKPNSNNIVIKIDTVFGAANSNVLVPVRAQNLNNVGAITLRITYDESLLEFVDSLNLNPQLAGALVGKSNGVISFAWDNIVGANLPNDKIVDLKFLNKSGGTTAPIIFLEAECEVADTYLNKLTVKYENGAIIPGLTINGKVMYANTVNTVLPDVKIYLKDQNGAVLDSTFTDNAGTYAFNGKNSGVYILSAVCTKPWGGVNSTDALAIRKHLSSGPYLTGLSVLAGDVNSSGDLNSTDALLIRKRIAYQINSFAAGDWFFGNYLVSTIASVTVDMKGLCTGDVNGSYIPAVGKTDGVLAYSNSGTVRGESGKEFTLPVSINKDCYLNAIYFVLNYPEDLLDFKGVSNKPDGALYASNNGNIYFAWDDLNSMRVNSNDPVINLKFKFKNGMKIEKPIYITLDPLSELADLNGKIKENLTVMIPAIGINLPDKYDLSQNYPNPFNPVTNIKYSLPYDSKVTITVYNMLGQTVAYLVNNAILPAGYHNIQFNAGKLSSGIYFYNIDAKSIDGTKQFHSVKKSVLLK